MLKKLITNKQISGMLQVISTCFYEILALNYAPGAAPPGTAAPGAAAPGTAAPGA